MSTGIVISIDSGTTSSRVFAYNSTSGQIETTSKKEIKQFYPKSGWMEEDANEIFDSVLYCITECTSSLLKKGFKVQDIKCIGITNQRETTIVWDKKSGKPLHRAIIWSDTRTDELVKYFSERSPNKKPDGFLNVVGLPISTYFSALKLHWLLTKVDEVKKAANEGRLLFGTVDSWLIWRLTGGTSHVTDVTNASRTMLMNLQTLNWDDSMCKFFSINKSILPRILCSSDQFGKLSQPSDNPLIGCPITGVLGDQQASLVGQNCLTAGATKVTYGTGAFLLINMGVGEPPKFSKAGLLTTVAYKWASDNKACYAFEGSMPMAAGVVNWLRDTLGVLKSVEKELDELVKSTPDSGGCVVVPAFSGLFCPHWRSDARGLVCGLSHSVGRAQLCRASLEAVAFQTRDIVLAAAADQRHQIKHMRIDGGLSNSPVFCGILADICELEVSRPKMVEATSLGAAVAACRGCGIDPSVLISHISDGLTTFKGSLDSSSVNRLYQAWLKAVAKSYDS